ncbi:hypothetical protein ACGFT2_13670 [Streptomyces sp. NPDC048514]|uniref:hypothetical protein n=1 Tax=Streptomyces sp. NPDC048514 TaxID=3365564 RepID=UPI00371A636E
MDREESVCPVCGQPVATVVRRHKTLGAWVPVWGPAPCGNPDCAAGTGTDVAATPPAEPPARRQPGEPAGK